MKVYDALDIRNIAIVGHGGDGKTTLVEALLYKAGATERRGRIEDGNTVTDFDPEETRRKISISTAIAPVEYQGTKLNLIDAPGFFDFVGEQTQAYYLADSALLVVGALSGLAVGAEKAYEYCQKHKKPLAVVVSQMSKENANFFKVVDEMTEKFGSGVSIAQIPIMDGFDFKGVVDIISNKAYEFDNKGGRNEIPIPDDLADIVEEKREQFIENAAGNDEVLMEKFFSGEELTVDEIITGLRDGVNAADVIPVFCVSSTKDRGINTLAEAMVRYMPSAAKAQPKVAKDEKDAEVEVKIDASAPFAAQVIKTIADPFVGKISLFKVYSGVLKSDTHLFNVTKDKPEKFGHITILRGKKPIDVAELRAGDIGALAKLQYTSTGDSLCDASKKLAFDPIEFDKPCISLAVGAKKQGEEEKVFSGLARLEEEDPTFTISKQTETGEILANGMGEMHIDVIMQKLKNKFGVQASLHDPRIPYRETIKKKAEAEGKHKKQSGGAGQFGVVNIRFEPLFDSDKEFEFVNAIVGGVVPREYVPAVEKGLRESMVKGVLAGYPMVNVRATLFDGKYHPVDSKEVAFKSAARLSFKKACAAASPVLLEPICKAEVYVPDDYMGDIIGDMNKRRGRILGMNPQEGGVQQVVAEVPMSEMFKYATDLRSMTQARGSFTLEFERYDEVPANIAQKVIDKAQLDDDDE